jgi:hypothetical protein
LEEKLQIWMHAFLYTVLVLYNTCLHWLPTKIYILASVKLGSDYKILNTKIWKWKKESQNIRLERKWKHQKKMQKEMPNYSVEQKTQWFRG